MESGCRTSSLKRVATIRNKGYNSLRRNFMTEIPRKWLTLGLRRKSPLDIFRNEIYSQDRWHSLYKNYEKNYDNKRIY